ncbi:MAG: response regulator transcription factor [Immundisolibacterales bacterium]|nr:response regulator transcription factor [Immundisolibacterales bacterium]
MRALIIEDDDVVAKFIAKGLRQHGYLVDVARDGRDGLFHALEQAYDVMVVDRMLPGLDGLAVLKTVRSAGNTTPILILSALAEVDNRVEGLRAGGDDYLTKPFAFSELIARLEALQRRPRGGVATDTVYRAGDLELDPRRRTVARAGELIRVLPREFALLEYLMRHRGQVVTRTMLLENVWDYHFDPQTNVVDVHVSRLRAKVDRPFSQPLIETVRGVGYRLRDPED